MDYFDQLYEKFDNLSATDLNQLITDGKALDYLEYLNNDYKRLDKFKVQPASFLTSISYSHHLIDFLKLCLKENNEMMRTQLVDLVLTPTNFDVFTVTAPFFLKKLMGVSPDKFFEEFFLKLGTIPSLDPKNILHAQGLNNFYLNFIEATKYNLDNQEALFQYLYGYWLDTSADRGNYMLLTTAILKKFSQTLPEYVYEYVFKSQNMLSLAEISFGFKDRVLPNLINEKNAKEVLDLIIEDGIGTYYANALLKISEYGFIEYKSTET